MVNSPPQQSAPDYSNKYFLGSGDQPEQQLHSHKFNGDNFLTWNRLARMALGAKNKLCFIDGTCKRPESTSADLQKWIRNDYMVQSWLLNSMEKSIAGDFILQQSAQELYEEILERYGQSNAPQLFELHKTLTSIEQLSDSIVVYYSKLKRVWDEIQLLEGFPDCDCGALARCTCGLLKKVLAADQKQKLIQLLAGLNRDYDQTKTNILSTDPLPTVNKAYYILLQVERQNKLNEKPHTEVQQSAFVSMKQHHSSYSQGGKRDFKNPRVDKNDRKCDHCKRVGHTIDQCFKLTGYPDWWTNMKNKST